MKKVNLFSRVMAAVLCVMMIMGNISLGAFAEWNNVTYDQATFGTDGYYKVISQKDYVLVPGAATETEMVLNNATGTRRQVLHIIEVDPSNPDVSIVPGYYQIDKDLENEANWSHKELTEMAKYYEDTLGYNIVGGMNTDLYYSSFSPRVLVYNGKWIGNAGENVATGGTALGYTSSILYVFKDAEGNVSCDVKAFNKAEVDAYLADGTLLHAVGVSFGMVVNNGELVNKNVARGTDDAARSMVGVKEDGTLVICMNDGRGANNSVGFSSYEEGEAMLALGCKWAANCDGGGSSTFLTKRVGEETFTMRSVPCDGSQRPTAHGIFVASNVGPTGELDVINVESDYDYFAPNTVYNFGATAIDTHGYAMDMPADVSWALSDNSFGTIANGKFTSNGTKGEVDVQILSGGKVVGTKTITVADPEVFKLAQTSTVVPYSTADKVRTITLPIVSMIGEANVYVDTNAVSVTLSDTKAGVLDGFKFTATDDTAIAGVNVTVTYGSTSLVYAIEFGKGSEIIFDFEDGDKAGFMGFEEAKKWSKENGVNNTLVGSDPLAGQFNEYLSSTTFVATAENGGQVRNGDYALAWRLDNTDAAFASWSYNVLFNTDETVVLRDVANGMKATALGMWLYIPENAFPSAGKGLAFQSQLYVKNEDGSYSCKQDHFMFTSAATGNLTNLNSATNADIPESRWVYASIDISKYDYLCTPVATDEGNSRSPSFIRTYVKPDTADEVTFYIDDITLDYSSAVDDRVLPVIANPTYSTADTAVTLENGAAINGNKIAFSATVSDNAALDAASGKIFVDGVELKATVAGGMLSSSEDAVLTAGAHTVAFEIKDELGNPAKITRSFTVAGDAVVTLAGHNDSGEAAKAQSVYYVDINAADLTKVNKLVASLKLNNSNTWETEGAVVANGFKATYAYNEISELLTVTVEAEDASKAEGNTLVSIPVRVWTYDRYNYVTETPYDPAQYTENKPVVNIDCEVVYGNIELSDKTASPVGGSISVATELTTISSPYHIHDAELTVLNKAATASEAGYENRTYCETCKSVVDWGTVIPKVEITHNYVLDGDKFVCSDEGCGHVYESGTGIFEMNGKVYYSIAGALVNDWQQVGDDWYYFNIKGSNIYSAVTGEFGWCGIIFHFGEDGKLTTGSWDFGKYGTRYYLGPNCYRALKGSNVWWADIDGKTYGFGYDGFRYEGPAILKEGYVMPQILHYFDEEGVYLGRSHENGIKNINGKDYYLVDGVITSSGLIKIDNDYYYLHSNGTYATGALSIPVSGLNGYFEKAGVYYFDDEGKMRNEEIYNGVYFENGQPYHKGVFQYTDGNYYYIRSYGKVATGTHAITEKEMNGLFNGTGVYYFDDEGKMLHEYIREDGVYFENGQPYKKGVFQYSDGYYYYIRSYGKITTGAYYISDKDLNGLFNGAGVYYFDDQGRMLHEVVREDGVYFENGQPYHKGVFLHSDGNYYYARSYGKLTTGAYYISAADLNGLFKGAGVYYFGSDYKMLHEIVREDGVYFEDGQPCYRGLVEYNGDIYYAGSYGKIKKGVTYTVKEAYTNGILPAGTYTFDAEGKLITE